MKKVVNVISLVVISCVFCLGSSISYAAEGQDHKTSIEISFGESSKEEPEKPIKEETKPVIKDDSRKPLPKTGELLASLIFLLMGVALIIVVLGIFTMKKIYRLDYQFKEAI